MPTLHTHTHTDLSKEGRWNVDTNNSVFLQSWFRPPTALFINLWEAESVPM